MGMGMVQVRVLSCLIMMERNTGSDLVRVICTYGDRLKNSVNFRTFCLQSAGLLKVTKLEYKISFEIKIFNRLFFSIFNFLPQQIAAVTTYDVLPRVRYSLSRLTVELYCILHIVIRVMKLTKLCFCVFVCIDEALSVITRNSLLN
jgi:hypothetical protein